VGIRLDLAPDRLDAEGTASGWVHGVLGTEGEVAGSASFTFDGPGVLKVGQITQVKQLLVSSFGTDLAELAMHAWNLVKATGQQADLDPVLAEHALSWSRQILRPEFRGPGQAFGPEVPVSPDAPIYQRLAGWFGRDPGWTPDGTGTRGANVE